MAPRGRGFGLSARGGGRGSSTTRFRGGSSWRGGRGRGRGGARAADAGPAPRREDDGTAMAERFEMIKTNDEVDERLGFIRIEEGNRKEGWLINMHPVRTHTASTHHVAHHLQDDSEGF